MKSLSEESGVKIRSLAVKNKSHTFWNEIFHGEKILSDEEANDMLKEITKIRKEKWSFRI